MEVPLVELGSELCCMSIVIVEDLIHLTQVHHPHHTLVVGQVCKNALGPQADRRRGAEAVQCSPTCA